MTNEIRDMASQFEAVKIAMTQTKDGHILKLAINPVDTPEDIMRDIVGQRYMVAVVRIDTDDQPIPSKQGADGAHAIKLAATLCNNTTFQSFLVDKGIADELGFAEADAGLKSYLDIGSKKEFRTDSQAREHLFALREEFKEYISQTERIRNGDHGGFR